MYDEQAFDQFWGKFADFFKVNYGDINEQVVRNIFWEGYDLGFVHATSKEEEY